MTPLYRNRAFLVVVGMVVAFVAASLFMPSVSLKRLMDAGRLGVNLTAAAICFRPAWNAFWSGAKTGQDQIAISFAALFTAVLALSIWVPVQREVPLPGWVDPTLVGAFIALMFIIAGGFFLVPVGHAASASFPRNWRLVVIATAIASGVAGLMFGLGIGASVS